MTDNKRFIVIDVPYENGEPFLYKKMLDKTTKKEYDNSLKSIYDMCDLSNKLHEETEQLKQELDSFRRWEKYVGNVKREDLNRVFRMSIYEIAEAFQYYEERIKELEDLNDRK